jgi:carboxypeptidase PM20D1
VNFRLLPGDTAEGVVEYIREVINDPLVALSYDPWENVPPISDHQAAGFQVISEAVTAIYPEALVTPSLLTATTDTRHYIELSDNQYRFHGAMMSAEVNPDCPGNAAARGPVVLQGRCLFVCRQGAHRAP